MEYRVNINLTKEYFSESFDQSIKYGSKLRKIEYIISALFFVSGIALFIYSNWETLLPSVFILIAVIEFLSPYIKKPFWLKRQMSNKVAGSNVEMILSEKGITSKGPYSEGTIAWEGIERVLETPLGLIVWPQKGIQIYFSKSTIGQNEIDYVLSKCA